MSGPARLAALALLLSLPAARVASQEAPPPPEPRTVEGQVVRPAGEGLVPVPDVWVVLHRVGSDRQGPLDSVRTGRAGGYRFRYHTSGSEDAVYFVSASYGGLAYFSAPFRRAAVAGEDAELVVYDTASRGVPLSVRGHHIVVGEASGGTREVIEVYELSNDTSVTAIAASEREPVWSALLPSGASGGALREGDLGADAVEFEEGRVKLYAPIAPGLRQLAFSYRVPAADLPLAIPVEHASDVLEVLVEAPTADVAGARLTRVDPVEIEGRRFSRFLADAVPASAVVRVALAPDGGASRGLQVRIVAIAVGAAMLLAVARLATRARRVRVRGEAGEDPERLAREIAALDAAHERRRSPDEAEEAEYRSRRAALKARLGDALDRQRERR